MTLFPGPPSLPASAGYPRILAGILIFISVCLPAVQAHPGGLQNRLNAEVGADKILVTVWVTVTELGVLGGVPIDKLTGAVDMAALEDAAPRHDRYLLSHLTFQADGTSLTGSVVNLIPPESIGQGAVGPDNSHYRYFIEYPCSGVPGRLYFTHNVGTDAVADDGSPWNVTYTVNFGPPGQPAQTIARVPAGGEFIYLPRAGKAEVIPQAEALPLRPAAELTNAASRAGVYRGVRHPALWSLAASLAIISAGAVGFARRWSLLLCGALGGGILVLWLRGTVPPWLPGPLAGVAGLLAGADIIHDPSGQFGRRRCIVAVAGGTALGAALIIEGLSVVREHEAALAVQGASAFALGAFSVVSVCSLLFAEAWHRLFSRPVIAPRPLLQIAGLVAVCAAALHILLSLGIVK